MYEVWRSEGTSTERHSIAEWRWLAFGYRTRFQC
jgi:hypothetical protein